MTVTDACVCPYPAGDSSVMRMALEGRQLGFDSLVAMGVPSGEYAGLVIHKGVIIRGLPVQVVADRAKRYHKDGALVFVQAGENGFNRAVLSMRGVNVLCGIHVTERYAFDHVTARIAAENKVAIDISIGPLIRQRGIERQKVLNRYLDILVLSRKFGFPLLLSTHARTVLEMRSVREISGLASLAGFDLAEVERALGAVDTIQGERGSARVIA